MTSTVFWIGFEAMIERTKSRMPARITFDQAKKFAKSLATGEKDAGKIIATVLKDKVREMV